MTLDLDRRLFDQVSRLAAFRGGVRAVDDPAAGFQCDGQRFPLIILSEASSSPVSWLLSIKTVFPSRRARVWDEDQREAHAGRSMPEVTRSNMPS
jgi:hypothetical protein